MKFKIPDNWHINYLSIIFMKQLTVSLHPVKQFEIKDVNIIYGRNPVGLFTINYNIKEGNE